MSQSRTRPCRFFNSSDGCRKGNRCPFEHTGSGREQTAKLPTLGRRSSAQSAPRAPPGKCDFFWSTGSCSRAFDCRFEHVKSTATSNAKTAIDGDATARPLEVFTSPFLTTSGLSKMATSGADAFRDLDTTLDPQQTQSHLRNFLKENYRFMTSAQMCSFVRLLANASSMNKTWNDEDGQLFLSTIASGNGLLRLSDIIRHENVSGPITFDPKVLSFLRGYLPIFQYLSSKFVVKSTLSHCVNALYTLLHNNIGQVLVNVEKSVGAFMEARSFKEKASSSMTSGAVVFAPIVTVLYEYLSRFKTALASHEDLGPFVLKISQWIDSWSVDIFSASPTFDDHLTSAAQTEASVFAVDYLKDRMARVLSMINREKAVIDRSVARRSSLKATASLQVDFTHLMHTLRNDYEGPGEERRGGPRHDNDFIDISAIQIAPTEKELVSKLTPFLPANIPNAPHPFPSDSMQRLLDIQFRLLREELLAPLRISIQVLIDDIMSPSNRKTQLSDIRKKKGGRYNYQDQQNSSMFNLYTNVVFSKLDMDIRRGLVVELQLDAPPGSARSDKSSVRAAYWKNGKRLMQGGLVAVLWKRGGAPTIHLGVLCSTNDKLAESSKFQKDKLRVRVQFFESEVNFKILEHVRSRDKDNTGGERLLIESSVMFESIRPFLESLKRAPETIPFGRYLPHPISSSLADLHIAPPAYSKVPGFTFELLPLLRAENGGVGDHLGLDTTNTDSIAAARAALSQNSRLDPSQAEALVDALTREVSLIQGPPGTGKTFMGVELIRVLVKNNVGPILLIAFTNHALDHILGSIIQSKITTSVVRLGGRSADETIQKYSIEELQKASGRSYLDRAMKSEYSTLKKTEEEILELLERVVGTFVPPPILLDHLSIPYPDHVESLEEAPAWIHHVYSMQTVLDSADNDHQWEETRTGKRGNRKESYKTLYEFWRDAKDLRFLRDVKAQEAFGPPSSAGVNRYTDLLNIADEEVLGAQSHLSEDLETKALSDSEQDSLLNASGQGTSIDRLSSLLLQGDAEDFFEACGESGIPCEPISDRPIDVLLEIDACDVWNYSAIERVRLDAFWVSEYRESEYQSQKFRFEALSKRHEELREKQRSRDEEIRLNIMRNCKVVGCTTTGAAKLVSFIKSLSPQVMIVEEAGQVLESHILASLVDSIDHLVLIGDPLQLRPTLNNYALSMDNHRGKEIYRFDMSLMERLSSSKLPMSRLDVQRRMRPTISSLIRNTLYPKLIDHERVLQYDPVRGMVKDVFFLSHGNQEHGGGDDSVSKHNPYEVGMIKDLVKYLLRQGSYCEEGSIVVLCAYLGQLVKVRDALKEEMTVIIDERDRDALSKQEGDLIDDGGASIERVNVTQRVRVRSVDNYQGEEADIVILSLVRNSGEGHNLNQFDIASSRTRPKIGFLKSENRTNVALSRARQGLFILGNASDFSSQSPMWSSVITQLDSQGAVGDAIPIRCNQHPNDIRYISKPGELSNVSPDGGCLLSCNERLACGHSCSYNCHSDDSNHRNVFCTQPCPKLCTKGHPCRKQCAEACGKCPHPIYNVRLPCGHVHKSVPCHQMDSLADIRCMVEVRRALPTCEHSALLPCGYDVQKHKCQALCSGSLACCGKACKAKCYACQDSSAENAADLRALPRTRHCQHECGRPLYCEHSCCGICAPDHKCINKCQDNCRQTCSHSQCSLLCSTPCTPCQEACTWSCEHYACPLPCGSVCGRLPCDRMCKKNLPCGHRCPSVCGEACTDQICLECSSKEQLSSIADFIMQRTLDELDPTKGTIDELIITLPGCKHTFTVETLDGHCHMTEYYEQDNRGNWTSLKSPEPGYKVPPTCPTCRNAIRSPRYGRVYKRADLDILERNVASDMSISLQAAAMSFDSIDKVSLRKALTTESPSNVVNTSEKTTTESRRRAREEVISEGEDSELPVPWKALDPGEYMHGIQPHIARKWLGELKRIKVIYQQAFAVASTRSAHLKAWESAFSSLYRQEVESAVEDPSKAPRHPTEYAMRIARIKIGHAKPLADKRFCVEAIWLTIDIRLFLADVSQCWLKSISQEIVPGDPLFRSSWTEFITFIFGTCERDANIALRIAEASGSRKQSIRSRLYVLNVRLERFKYDFSLSPEKVLLPDFRVELLRQARDEQRRLRSTVDLENARQRESKEDGMPKEEFRSIFIEPMKAIEKDWEDLKLAIKNDSVYLPVSYEEKHQIVAALRANELEYSHTGHFYACSKGHSFIIGDCGGAMETTRCPECYELIGGTGHVLVSSNRRDTELEEILRSQGAIQSPHAWNR